MIIEWDATYCHRKLGEDEKSAQLTAVFENEKLMHVRLTTWVNWMVWKQDLTLEEARMLRDTLVELLAPEESLSTD